MKLPNHYGTVAKLSGNRRRPFVIREGKSGKQTIIGYASTREEGLQILAEYNKDPWDYGNKKLTFLKVYQLWLEKRAIKLSKSNVHSLTSVYKYCHSLENLPYHSLKAYHFQECIDQCQRSYATQSAIKNLFRHLDRFALELDIINKSYHPLLTTDSIPEGNKAVFTQQERNLIWEKRNIDWMDSLLVFLYTGFRISELLELKKEQVNLENQTLTGGKKTKAGKNRIIPIHSKILPLITQRMKMDGEFLFTMNGEQCTDSQYRTVWKRLMKELNMEHTPHECRHTFRSLLDSAGANPVCIDRLMGHKSLGVGERIYTHKSIEELKENIELVST